MQKDDMDIEQEVIRELGRDTRVSPTEIGVQVSNGVVTLTGLIDSPAKRVAAEQAAHRVAGVFDVASDLVVRPPGEAGRSDTEVAHAVRRALEWDVLVPDTDIRSTVANGVVTLEGHVHEWSERGDSERAVARLAGVRAVVNRIEIKPVVPVDTADIDLAIHRALERLADREAARIQVRPDDHGVVEVTGVVHTWSERDAVLGAVRAARGVRGVSDRLNVQPYE
jgi:osmotically-inducible protein OsmY